MHMRLFTLLVFLSPGVAVAVTGEQVFGAHCARCHAPIEIERRLNGDWAGRTADQLFMATRQSMPGESPGSLSDEEYFEVVGYMLGLAGVPHAELATSIANLAGLTIHSVRASPVFAGQHSEFEVLLSRSSNRQYYALHLKWKGGEGATVNLTDADEVHVKLYVQTTDRGWHNPGRLLVESVYPLGLLRTWTWVDLDVHALVYPRPLASGPLPGVATDKPDGSAVPIPGTDDFYGLRDYQRGDSLRHVFWKSVAKGLPLQSKQYTAYADRSVWLDWGLFEGLPPEQRLSHLCHRVLECDRSNEEYGLRLPGVVVEPDCGHNHRLLVLRQLAVWGIR